MDGEFSRSAIGDGDNTVCLRRFGLSPLGSVVVIIVSVRAPSHMISLRTGQAAVRPAERYVPQRFVICGAAGGIVMRVHADRLKATGSKVIPEDCSRSNDLDYSVFVQCALDVNDRSVGRCVQFPRKLINIEVFQRKRLERNLLARGSGGFLPPVRP